MMKYEEILKYVFAETSIPDGYFGDWSRCKLALIGNQVICIHAHGFHRSVLPPVIDINEALWMIENHGNYKRYFKNTKTI